MRSRSYSGSNFAYSFGPGSVTPAVKALLIINIAVFLLQQVVQELPLWFGLRPIDVVAGLQVWQALTDMFLHGSISHILFNMLSLWMFGTELSGCGARASSPATTWCAGVGAAATTILVSFFPGAIGAAALRRPVDRRRVGRHLRLAPRLRAYLPGPADPDVVPLPGAGEGLRDDYRRDRVPVGGGERRRRHRARDPSWRGLLVGWLYLRGRRCARRRKSIPSSAAGASTGHGGSSTCTRAGVASRPGPAHPLRSDWS